MFARKSYSALPEGMPDTLAIYMVDGNPITFPYDFPIGTTTVEVKANTSCAIDIACSFKVIVRQVTRIEDLNAKKPSGEVYPNPFTLEIFVEIANPSLSKVSVDVYSISGQKIKTLARALYEAKISLIWDGSNEQGQQVPEGMYLLKINDQTQKVVKK